MTYARYCACGGYLKATGMPDRTAALDAFWTRMHNGDGHQDCDKATARAAQRKADAAAYRREDDCDG